VNVLVTGAAGFIGSNFVRFLVEKRPNWRVSALDLLTYAGNLENIADLLSKKQIDFIKADIADSQAIDKIFKAGNFELVFHLAAESHVDRSIHSASEFVRTNILGTQNLLDSAMANKVKRFVHISTDEVYGSLGPTGYFVETTPLDPTSPYAASKAASDLMVLAAAKTHKFDCVVTRCTNNYGPYQFPEKFIPLSVTNLVEGKKIPLYGDGMNVRSWLHVNDHSEALLLVGEKGKAGEVYNIGSAQEDELPNITVSKELLRALGKAESSIEYVKDRPAHDRRYAIDYTKIKNDLGWTPKIRFTQGLKQTVEWYLANEKWWRSIKSGEYLKFYEKNYSNR